VSVFCSAVASSALAVACHERMKDGGPYTDAALHRLAALRFHCFAACIFAPSPRGSGQGMVAAQTCAGKGPGAR
jgi:hypothetical protein